MRATTTAQRLRQHWDSISDAYLSQNCTKGDSCAFLHPRDGGLEGLAFGVAPEPEGRPEPEICTMHVQSLACLESLAIAPGYLKSDFNRCYCATCWTVHNDVLDHGHSQYVIPKGWYRFGLQLPPRASDPELDIFNRWSVSFHGVKSKPVLKSILQQVTSGGIKIGFWLRVPKF